MAAISSGNNNWGCLCLHKNPLRESSPFFVTTTTAAYSTISQTQVGNVLDEGLEQLKDSENILRRWGCSDDDISKIFSRRPSLRNSDCAQLQLKLSLLKALGITSADLVTIINRRPQFFNYRINHCFEERLEYLRKLFGSRELLVKSITRNSALLTYDFHSRIKPVIALYEGLGVGQRDLITMLVSRPNLIGRTSFDDEKMEYICKTGTSKNSKMYKHVVTLIGTSRVETIREKVANFEKFGLSDREVWSLFGRAPFLLALSADRVQRNMTYVVGMLKLPANVVIKRPFLLYHNLEAAMKPRMLLARKIHDMGLCPKIEGPLMLRALKMKEKQFLKIFVSCHPNDVAEELMEFYTDAKGVKRLAEASRKNIRRGLPY